MPEQILFRSSSTVDYRACDIGMGFYAVERDNVISVAQAAHPVAGASFSRNVSVFILPAYEYEQLRWSGEIPANPLGDFVVIGDEYRRVMAGRPLADLTSGDPAMTDAVLELMVSGHDDQRIFHAFLRGDRRAEDVLVISGGRMMARPLAPPEPQREPVPAMSA